MRYMPASVSLVVAYHFDNLHPNTLFLETPALGAGLHTSIIRGCTLCDVQMQTLEAVSPSCVVLLCDAYLIIHRTSTDRYRCAFHLKGLLNAHIPLFL